VTERTAQRRPAADAGATAGFERLYRANVDAVTAYFARRSADHATCCACPIRRADGNDLAQPDGRSM